MKSVLDRSFQYTPSHSTDLERTFARIKRQLRDERRNKERAEAAHLAQLDRNREELESKLRHITERKA